MKDLLPELLLEKGIDPFHAKWSTAQGAKYAETVQPAEAGVRLKTLLPAGEAGTVLYGLQFFAKFCRDRNI
jgi:hypothetical protein